MQPVIDWNTLLSLSMVSKQASFFCPLIPRVNKTTFFFSPPTCSAFQRVTKLLTTHSAVTPLRYTHLSATWHSRCNFSSIRKKNLFVYHVQSKLISFFTASRVGEQQLEDSWGGQQEAPTGTTAPTMSSGALYCKPDSCQSWSGVKEKHLLHWEKPSELLFVVLWNTTQLWWSSRSVLTSLTGSSWAHIQSSVCCLFRSGF